MLKIVADTNVLISSLLEIGPSKMITDNFSSLILADATIVTPTHTVNICRDPKDNKVLECAIQAKANIIATGDKDLLILHPFHGIDIIPSSEVIKRIA